MVRQQDRHRCLGQLIYSIDHIDLPKGGKTMQLSVFSRRELVSGSLVQR